MSLAELGLSHSATVAEVKTAWRQRAAAVHPDRGGSADTFHQLRQAYEAALIEAAQPLPCPVCAGSGLRAVGTGFNQVKLQCLACFGARFIDRG